MRFATLKFVSIKTEFFLLNEDNQFTKKHGHSSSLLILVIHLELFLEPLV